MKRTHRENDTDMKGDLRGMEGDMTRKNILKQMPRHEKDMTGKSKGKPVVRRQFRGHEGAVHGTCGNSGGGMTLQCKQRERERERQRQRQRKSERKGPRSRKRQSRRQKERQRGKRHEVGRMRHGEAVEKDRDIERRERERERETGIERQERARERERDREKGIARQERVR